MQNKIKSAPIKPVVVIGAGWAGLATACYLASQDIPVTLIESAKQLGGRARKSASRTQVLDNGQHLMLGAYHELLDLLALIGIEERSVFQRTKQYLKLIDGKYLNTILELKLPGLPSPLNLVLGLLLAKGMSFKEKIQVLTKFDKALKQTLNKKSDTTVAEWLKSINLPASYNKFLESLCLAALSTPVETASALNFQTVLKQTFNGPARYTDLLIPAVNLGNVLPAPARQYLLQKSATIKSPARVTHLQASAETIRQVILGDSGIEPSAVVLATPPYISSQLLKSFESCNEFCHRLDQLNYEPITTVYLRYPEECQIPENMIGMEGTVSQWVFDRRVCEQAGMIAVVISSDGKHMDMDNKDLSLVVRNELSVLFPDWPKPNASWVIREKRATFSCTPESSKYRPGVTTPFNNLFLAGDYLVTNNEYLPATLETAVRNAKACAEEVIKYLNS